MHWTMPTVFSLGVDHQVVDVTLKLSAVCFSCKYHFFPPQSDKLFRGNYGSQMKNEFWHSFHDIKQEAKVILTSRQQIIWCLPQKLVWSRTALVLTCIHCLRIFWVACSLLCSHILPRYSFFSPTVQKHACSVNCCLWIDPWSECEWQLFSFVSVLVLWWTGHLSREYHASCSATAGIGSRFPTTLNRIMKNDWKRIFGLYCFMTNFPNGLLHLQHGVLRSHMSVPLKLSIQVKLQTCFSSRGGG